VKKATHRKSRKVKKASDGGFFHLMRFSLDGFFHLELILGGISPGGFFPGGFFPTTIDLDR